MPERESLLPQFKLLSRRSALGLCFAVLSAAVQLLCGGWYTSAIVFALLFLILGMIRFRLPEKAQLPVFLPVFLCAVVVIFWLSQYSLGAPLSALRTGTACLGLLICAIVLLLFLLLTAHPFWGLCIGMCVLLLLTTIDYFVFAFRGTELTPLDILSFKTALNTVETYLFVPSLALVRAWVILLLFLWGVSALHLQKLPRLPLSLVSLPLLVLMVFSLKSGMRPLTPLYYVQTGTFENGYFLNFALSLGQTFVRKPADYDPDVLRALPVSDASGHSASRPVVIAIMNESFSDLSVFGDVFKTDEEVMPFYRSLSENAIKGYACSSVYGGSTANSEFEFLTGNSMAFLPTGSIPYQQYVKDKCYSMVSVLKSYGYTCVSMTPWFGGGWNLYQVYPNLGFDEVYFKDYFEMAPTIRSFVSDRGMYEKMIRYYEEHDNSTPLFLFGVTMQNHGGYTVDEAIFPSVIHLEGFSKHYPDAEQYLSLIHESDDALAYLVDYFSGVDDDVVLVFFGDHQPRLSSDFYGELHGANADTLDERQKDYLIPFLVWTNYDSPSPTPPLTSLNYLSNYVFEAAGIPLPPYNQYLRQFQQTVPAVNSLGYYSPDAGRFLPVSEAAGEEAETLRLYEQLEYNALFDSKNRLSMFRAGADG